MENEKDLLKKELETVGEDKAGLEKFKEDAELMGHEDLVALAQEKLNTLNTQVEEITTQADLKIESAEERGGDSAELTAVIAPIHEEVKVVQEEMVEKIGEIEKTEEASDIHESISGKINTAEKNLAATEEGLNNADQMITSAVQEIQNITNSTDKFNRSVKLAADVAELIGSPVVGNDYFNLLRNPDLYSLPNEKVALELSNISSTIDPKTGKGSVNESDYSEKSLVLMEKQKQIEDRAKNILKQVVSIREHSDISSHLDGFGALISNGGKAEKALELGVITSDEVITKFQTVITKFIEQCKKDNDSLDEIRSNLDDNLEEVKVRFKNPQLYEEIMSKVKISI